MHVKCPSREPDPWDLLKKKTSFPTYGLKVQGRKGLSPYAKEPC